MALTVPMAVVPPSSPLGVSRLLPPFVSPSMPQLPPLREAFREPLPLPPSLRDDAYRDPNMLPPTDEQLQSSIEERFRDAYANQIEHLQRSAEQEMSVVENDIERLRRLAYTAQNSAADHARCADVARAALREREADSRAVQYALNQAQRAFQAEAAVVHEQKASLRHLEWEYSEFKARADQEISEMKAYYNSVSLHGQAEKQMLAKLEKELAATRAETHVELEVAKEMASRAEKATAATAEAKAGLAWRDSVAEQTLREAVQRLEADFARERAEFLEQDKRSHARVQAIEREAQKEPWGALVGRAIARPQAVSSNPTVAPASQNYSS